MLTIAFISDCHLCLYPVHWEEFQCTAKVIDVYSAIAGSHRLVAASSSWSISLICEGNFHLPPNIDTNKTSLLPNSMHTSKDIDGMLQNMPSIRKWMKISCFQSYRSHKH
jgi:hypothetical protein